MRLAWITCTELPDPDPDLKPGLAALAGAGLEVEVIDWRAGPAAEVLSGFDGALIRSPWDYHFAPEEFLRWCDGAASVTQLLNGAEVVHANHHKGYLLELAERGVPVVPTVLARRGERVDLHGLLLERGWGQVVVKPAISGGSWRTRRFAIQHGQAAQAFLESLTREGDALVQPGLDAFADPGERCIVWFAGAVSHVVRKAPRLAGDEESVVAADPASDAELALLDAARATLPGNPLYLRLDTIEHGGRPVVAELEAIEPSMFFDLAPGSAARFAAAVAERLGAGS